MKYAGGVAQSGFVTLRTYLKDEPRESGKWRKAFPSGGLQFYFGSKVARTYAFEVRGFMRRRTADLKSAGRRDESRMKRRKE
jgi:hypothetical protein